MEFKVGDIVEIKDNGRTFTTWGDKFIEMGFVNKTNNPLLPNGTIGKIFAFSEHPRDGAIIIAIRDREGNEVLVDTEGVELVTFETKLKSIQLNSTYSAMVYPDRIEVGCQTISKENFQNLVNAA